MNIRVKNAINKITLTSLSIFALLIIYSQSGFTNFLIFTFTLLIHELSHIFTAKMFSVKVDNISLLPFGAKISYHLHDIRPDKEFLVYLSGPFSNFVLAGIIAFAGFYIYIPSYDFFIFYNVLIGSINLIPTIPLDASRCIMTLLNMKLDRRDSFKYIFIISFIVNCCVLFLGIYVLLLGSKNVLLILLSVFLFNNLKSEKDKIDYYLIKNNKMLNKDLLNN